MQPPGLWKQKKPVRSKQNLKTNKQNTWHKEHSEASQPTCTGQQTQGYNNRKRDQSKRVIGVGHELITGW